MGPELRVMVMELEETDLRYMEVGRHKVKMIASARSFHSSKLLPFVVHSALSCKPVLRLVQKFKILN